ncbi:DNA repair family protein [Xylaria cf. heliscus]|nr:DNA repair family protein [Xylaria cf. heliscus]
MSNKRTIDANLGMPKAKRPRQSGLIIEMVTGAQLSAGRSPIGYIRTKKKEAAGYTTHASYPFPIPHLPVALEAKISGPPALAAQAINDQPDLDLLFFDPFIWMDPARELFEFLRAELPFYRVEYDIMRGATKTHVRTPRWTTVFGVDETARFETSPASESSSLSNAQPTIGTVVDARTGKPVPVGQTDTPGPSRQTGYKATPRPIPHCLDVLRRATEAATGCQFNFCLVNYYDSGADSISFHSDDEQFLGPLPAIASFSLGTSRDFVMKRKPPTSEQGEANVNETPTPPLKLKLVTGDMLLMRGRTQANWLHSIPKRTGRNVWDGGRINITYRRALVRGGTENYYQYNVGSGPVHKWDDTAKEMRPWIQAPKP